MDRRSLLKLLGLAPAAAAAAQLTPAVAAVPLASNHVPAQAMFDGMRYNSVIIREVPELSEWRKALIEDYVKDNVFTPYVEKAQ